MAKKKLFGNLFKKRKKREKAISYEEMIKATRGVTDASKGSGQKKRQTATEIATHLNDTLPQAIKEDKIVEFMDAYGLSTQLEPSEKKMFIAIATEFQLNPFKREIYCVPYGEGKYRKLSIITGYEVYLKRAERSGLLDGWNLETIGTGNDMQSTITIYRKDRQHPVKKTVRYSEYVQTKHDGTITKFWKEKPVTMIEKVATAQGFRLAFPDELGGMPYTADELPEEMTQPKNVTPVDRPAVKKTNGPDVVIETPKETPQPAKTEPVKTPEPRNVTPVKKEPEKIVEEVFAKKTPLSIQQDKVAAAYKLIASFLTDAERKAYSGDMKEAMNSIEALKKLEKEFQNYTPTTVYQEGL